MPQQKRRSASPDGAPKTQARAETASSAPSNWAATGASPRRRTAVWTRSPSVSRFHRLADQRNDDGECQRSQAFSFAAAADCSRTPRDCQSAQRQIEQASSAWKVVGANRKQIVSSRSVRSRAEARARARARVRWSRAPAPRAERQKQALQPEQQLASVEAWTRSPQWALWLVQVRARRPPPLASPRYLFP